MRFHIITLFPEVFDSYLKESILGRALQKKIISVKFYNPRDAIRPRKGKTLKQVDDKPYGGGPGMVMRAEPIIKTVEKILKKINRRKNPKILVINFVPSSEKFTTTLAKKYSKKYTDLILICGRYEGIDARVDKIFKTKKISMGDYVVTGGELPAMILIDCISRQIEGVLGNFESREEERISSSEVYTRPEILEHKGKKYKVPKILLSGNHKEIDKWRRGREE